MHVTPNDASQKETPLHVFIAQLQSQGIFKTVHELPVGGGAICAKMGVVPCAAMGSGMTLTGVRATCERPSAPQQVHKRVLELLFCRIWS